MPEEEESTSALGLFLQSQIKNKDFKRGHHSELALGSLHIYSTANCIVIMPLSNLLIIREYSVWLSRFETAQRFQTFIYVMRFVMSL